MDPHNTHGPVYQQAIANTRGAYIQFRKNNLRGTRLYYASSKDKIASKRSSFGERLKSRKGSAKALSYSQANSCYDMVHVNKTSMNKERYEQKLSKIKESARLSELHSESLAFVDYSAVDGVRQYILEWYNDLFLTTFYTKKEPDTKCRHGEILSESRNALTTEQLVDATS